MKPIKEYRQLTDEKWLNLFEVNYVAKNGEDRSWKIASRQKQPKCVSGRFDPPDAVVIVPFHTAKNKMVIIREYRVPLNDYEYGFPAGLVDAGESVEQAAWRELMEETGLTVRRLLKSSPPLYSSAGMSDESVAMVYVECEGEPPGRTGTDCEQIEVLFISAAEASAMLEDATLKFDVKTWLEISRFAAGNNSGGNPDR
jgi:ADP-ribose pyrophosphatase